MWRRLFAAAEGKREAKGKSRCRFSKINFSFSSQPLFSPVLLLNTSGFGDSPTNQVLFHHAQCRSEQIYILTNDDLNPTASPLSPHLLPNTRKTRLNSIPSSTWGFLMTASPVSLNLHHSAFLRALSL